MAQFFKNSPIFLKMAQFFKKWPNFSKNSPIFQKIAKYFKNGPIFIKNSQNSCQAKKGQNNYIKGQC
jgi:hypothetical protein